MFARLKLLSLLLALFIGAHGCASYQVGIVDTRSVETYAGHVANDGVSVAADPYDSAEKATRVFYQDVTNEGFFPIHLIFKNDTGDRVIVLRETIELIHASGNIYRHVRSTAMYNVFEKNKMAYALLGFGIFSYMSAEEANRKMETDYRDKEISEQLIIMPGLRASGFAYFKLPKGNTTKGSTLRLQAERLDTRQKLPFEIRL